VGLGEGRVRGCEFGCLGILEPLTSILSPCTKGRGGQKRTEFVGALIREVSCGVICCRVASLFIRSRVHRLSLGKGEGRVRVVGLALVVLQSPSPPFSSLSLRGEATHTHRDLSEAS
jgi:hypothetical protein